MNTRGVLVRLQKSYGESDRGAAPVLLLVLLRAMTQDHEKLASHLKSNPWVRLVRSTRADEWDKPHRAHDTLQAL